jgi:hypothetical protein
VVDAPQFELDGRVPGLDHGVAAPTRACHELGDTKPLAGLPERPSRVFAALVGMEDDAGHAAAAHRHRHGQRAVSQLGVVVVADGEPDYGPGSHEQDRVQVQLAFTGADLGAVAVPFLVDRRRRECRFTRSGARRRPLPGRVVDRRFLSCRASRPSSSISPATVFSLTRHPASRRSAVIRGEP